MKKKTFLVIFTLSVCLILSSCAADSPKDEYHEVYSVDYEYFFYVPLKYENNISSFGYANTMVVRYSSSAHALVNIERYYSGLTSEERGGHIASEFTLGNPVLDSTFNSKAYMEEYFRDYFDSISSISSVSSVKKVSVNSRSYWCCRAYSFYSDYDANKDSAIEKFKGETLLYFTVYKGMSYFINISSSGGTFINECSAARDFVNNFHLGVRVSDSVRYIWMFVGVLILLDLIFIFSVFFKFSWEPLYITRQEPGYISPLSLISPEMSYGSSHIASIRRGILMDDILERFTEKDTIYSEDETLLEMQQKAQADEYRKEAPSTIKELSKEHLAKIYSPKINEIEGIERQTQSALELSLNENESYSDEEDNKKPSVSYRLKEALARGRSKYKEFAFIRSERNKDRLLRLRRLFAEKIFALEESLKNTSYKIEIKLKKTDKPEAEKESLAINGLSEERIPLEGEKNNLSLISSESVSKPQEDSALTDSGAIMDCILERSLPDNPQAPVESTKESLLSHNEGLMYKEEAVNTDKEEKQSDEKPQDSLNEGSLASNEESFEDEEEVFSESVDDGVIKGSISDLLSCCRSISKEEVLPEEMIRESAAEEDKEKSDHENRDN